MKDDIESLIGEIHESIVKEDSNKLKGVVDDFATCCYNENPDGLEFNERVFNFILEMMSQPQFLNMEGAHHLLYLFEYDWAMLTPLQKIKLSGAIEHSYHKYKDWMACFVLSELLGKNYCDENAFQVLHKLNNSLREIPRSLLPMGFEYLARGTSDLVLKNKSISELKRMTTDSSKQVQKEANESLSRLA
jgi:hypothetical protein